MLNACKYKKEVDAAGAHFALLKFDGNWEPYPCNQVYDCNECLFHKYREGVPPHKAVNCFEARILWLMQEAE